MIDNDGVSLWIGGGVLGAWIKARCAPKNPQPFVVTKPEQDNLWTSNERDHEAIFTRLHIVEKAVARHDGVIDRLMPQIDRIENKLDRLIEGERNVRL